MQITSCKTTNITYVQVYLTEEEMQEKQTKEILDEFRKEKCSVALFITGKEDYPEILEKIVMKQVELSRNVC